MKKIFITTLILFLSTTSAHCAQQVEEMFSNVLNLHENFFQSAVAPEVQIKEETINNNVKNDDELFNIKTDKYVEHMPFFKINRLRLQKKYKEFAQKSDQKAAEREAKRAQQEEEKELQQLKQFGIEENTQTISNKEDNKEISKDNTEDIELTGGVKEQVTSKEIVLDCDEIQYDSQTADVKAIGSPKLEFPNHNTTITADLIVYNRDSNIIKAIDNVVLIRDGIPVYGDYIQINMNEENIFMDNPKTGSVDVKINAKKGVSEEGKLILEEGSVVSNKNQKLFLDSDMGGIDFTRMIISPEDRQELFTPDKTKIKLSASQVNIDAGTTRDIFQVKDTELFYNDKYILTVPSFTAYTNKKREYFEANLPEFGSRSQMGMFIGPGVVFGGPYGSTLKVLPLLNYNNKIGVGGAVKFKSAFNNTEIMYGSANEALIVKGKQNLDENLYLQYGMNSYMDDWFLGYRMPKYLAELVYDKPTVKKDFLADNLDLRFRHRASIAYAHDGDWNMYSEDISTSNMGTMRLRYMAEIRQSLFKYDDRKNRKLFNLSLVMQGSAAVYGTGDTQFIGRIGPNIHTQYKYWMQDIGYFMSAYSDETPLPVYDMYRYGRSNLYIREALRVCKYLTIGWMGSLSFGQDTPNAQVFQENAFVVSIGPDDLKLNLAYDVFRQSTYCGVSVAIDTTHTDIQYDKMVIKNPENLNKSNRPNDSLAFISNKPQENKDKKLIYAEVIDIEDPDRESIQ